jgi:hypothetical protein
MVNTLAPLILNSHLANGQSRQTHLVFDGLHKATLTVARISNQLYEDHRLKLELDASPSQFHGKPFSLKEGEIREAVKSALQWAFSSLPKFDEIQTAAVPSEATRKADRQQRRIAKESRRMQESIEKTRKRQQAAARRMQESIEKTRKRQQAAARESRLNYERQRERLRNLSEVRGYH